LVWRSLGYSTFPQSQKNSVKKLLTQDILLTNIGVALE